MNAAVTTSITLNDSARLMLHFEASYRVPRLHRLTLNSLFESILDVRFFRSALMNTSKGGSLDVKMFTSSVESVSCIVTIVYTSVEIGTRILAAMLNITPFPCVGRLEVHLIADSKGNTKF
jgi:hypothetical protein